MSQLTDEELDGRVRETLRRYLDQELNAYTGAWNEPTQHQVASKVGFDPNFGSILTSYASLRRQELDSQDQDRLARSNRNLQIFLGVFAAISTLGTLVQALVAAHAFGILDRLTLERLI